MSVNRFPHKLRATTQTEERRTDERRLAEGEAVVVPTDFGMCPREGRLQDVSRQGFRMTYPTPPLFSGQEVHFLLPEAEGLARVIWTRVVNGQAESGFLILRLAKWQ